MGVRSGYLEGGMIHSTSGQLLGSLAGGGVDWHALTPVQAGVVAPEGSDVDVWTSDIAIVGGRPTALLTVKRPTPPPVAGRDFTQEYLHARWNGSSWVVHRLAWGGSELYDLQPSYTGNLTFDPYNKNAQGWDWYASDIKVPTLWDAAHAAGLRTANVHWPVSVGATVDWNLPQIWRAGTPDDRKLLRALETPGLERELEAEVRQPYADGIDESLAGDVTRGLYAAALIERRRPRVMTVYLTALDHEQHDKGPMTPQAFAVLERIDSIVGSLLDVAKKAYGNRVVVAVASDHALRWDNVIHADIVGDRQQT